MLRLMLQKLIHKKWLVISLLIGNILLVAIAASYPMYREATLQKMMITTFDNYMESNKVNPARIVMSHAMDEEKQTEDFWKMEEKSDLICKNLDLTMQNKVTQYTMSGASFDLKVPREKGEESRSVNVRSLSNMKEHCTILAGKTFSDTKGEDGYIDVVVSQATFKKMNLLMGEELICPYRKTKDGSDIKLRVVGIFTVKYDSDNYWNVAPSSLRDVFFISEDVFKSEFLYDKSFHNKVDGQWMVDFDYTKVKPEQVDTLIDQTKSMVTSSNLKYNAFSSPDYLKVLDEYKSKLNRTESTLFILIVPLFALLCAFIFMISNQMLNLEDSEIALLKSRGGSKLQIFRLYLLQSVCLSIGSLVLGLPLAGILCKILGSANAFLEFVNRTSLPIRYGKDVFLYSIGAVIVSILITILPIIKNSTVSIVSLKQKKARKQKSIWKKFYLDIIILIIALYGFYTFNQQKNDLLFRVISGKGINPLLFLSSSLFILGAALFTLRLQPLLVKLIYLIGRKRWKPANYASFLQIIRTGSKQHFIMTFMILTIALGIFNSTIARTIVLNAEKNTEYSVGTDLKLQEDLKINVNAIQTDLGGDWKWQEPEFNSYAQLPEVDGAAKVYLNSNVSCLLPNMDALEAKGIDGQVKASMMAIDTKDFGNTATLPEGLNEFLFNEYLNVLSTNPNAVLLSSNYKAKYGLKLGDIITVSGNNEESFSGVIYGFVDYWPTYKPRTMKVNEDESYVTEDNYLVIANLNSVQKSWGLQPYYIWLKLKNKDARFFYDYIKEKQINLGEFDDREQDVLNVSKDALFQGTNGILTMSFIIILILCCIGYLIYWILSIRGRELLFGVFRAMGMSKRNIVHMLVNEQLFTGGLSIALGAGIGILASNLYIPMIQISYAGDNQALPMELMTETSDMVRLFVIVALVFVVCMGVLAGLIYKLKIAEALKLGED